MLHNKSLNSNIIHNKNILLLLLLIHIIKHNNLIINIITIIISQVGLVPMLPLLPRLVLSHINYNKTCYLYNIVDMHQCNHHHHRQIHNNNIIMTQIVI